MARETYKTTDETWRVLSQHLSEFAEEADKDVSYFNKVKNGVEKDAFAHFLALFRVGCRTTAPVEIWLQKLQAVYTRSRRLHVPLVEMSRTLIEKLEKDAEFMSAAFSALQDNELDERECRDLLTRLAESSRIIAALEDSVQRRLGEIDAQRRTK